MPIKGKPTISSEDGTITTNSTRLKLIERAGRVSWKIQLEEGQTKTLTYEYERYVSSD